MRGVIEDLSLDLAREREAAKRLLEAAKKVDDQIIHGSYEDFCGAIASYEEVSG